MHTSASRVRNSIELLDSKAPKNWRTLVNWDKLNLLHCTFCVLGQIYGDYEDGLEALNIHCGGENYAFACFGYEDEEIEAEWRKQASITLTLLDELVAQKAIVMQEIDKLDAQRAVFDVRDKELNSRLDALQKCVNALS